MRMFKALRGFTKDESGASMVEYGLALLVVAGIGVTAMNALGTGTKGNVDAACSVVASSTHNSVTC